jgi:hypothetical protein
MLGNYLAYLSKNGGSTKMLANVIKHEWLLIFSSTCKAGKSPYDLKIDDQQK